MARISMILDSDFPPDPRVENEATTLIENGWEVHLLALSRVRKHNTVEIINSITVHYKTVNWLTYKLSALAYTVPFYHFLVKGLIKQFITESNPDYIHIHDMLIARAVFEANKGERKIVLDLHENRPEIMRFYPHMSTLLGKILIKIEKWKRWQTKLVHKADRVITVTELAKEQLCQESGIETTKVTVVPNTIKTDIFNSYTIDKSIVNRFKKRKVILYLGDTGLRRGTDTAIKAIAQLNDEHPDILLVLVGKSRDDEHLKKLASDLGVQHHVSFEGWQNLILFPSYTQAATITISPIKRNLHHDTTYANKLFQYMAYGKPIIVSDCPAQVDLINEIGCGLVHTAEDSKELAGLINTLLVNPNQAEALGQKGHAAVNGKYEWKNTSKDLVRLYTELAH